MNYFYDQVSVALCWAVVRRLLVALPAGAGAEDKIRSGCVCTEWMGVWVVVVIFLYSQSQPCFTVIVHNMLESEYGLFLRTFITKLFRKDSVFSKR